MFDLIIGTNQRPLRERSITSKVVAIAAHAVLIAVVLGIPLLQVTDNLPDLPTMRAFVVESAAPPAAPPPPPPPPASPPTVTRAAAKPVPANGVDAAPVDAPGEIEPERLTARN